MKSVICGKCDTRERAGFMKDGECRDCRGSDGEAVRHVETTNPHAEQASRHRVISNTVGNDL